MGLSISYVLLGGLAFLCYQQIPPSTLFWQLGILFSMALNFYIALLACEEIFSLISTLTSDMDQHIALLAKAGHEHEEEQQVWNDEKMSLEEEVKRWKEEAEQRKIEKQIADKHLLLVQSEIELFDQQKENLVKDAYEARAFAAERLQNMEESQLQMQILSTQVAPLKEEKELLLQKNLEHEKILCTLQEDIQKQREHSYLLEEEKRLLSVQLQSLQEEVTKKEQLVSTLNEEKILWEEKSAPADPEVVVQLSREKARVEGLYEQLRTQFEEKACVLSSTRKELFRAEGQLLAIDHEKKILPIDPSTDIQERELNILQTELMAMNQENLYLEQEITEMEALISRLLSQ